MAASNLDKLMEVGIATATTLDANYTINDTSITVASTSGWPTATGVAFAIDVVDSAGVQVPGTYNEYVGVVSSATSITSVDHVNGTDRNYSAGATTRVYIPVTAERENRIVEWGVVQHKQDGSHSAVVADSLATDTITEATAAAGVTVDGLLLKDSKLATNNSVVTTNITDANVTSGKLAEAFFRGRFQNLTTNTAPTGLTIQAGFSFIQGAGNNSSSKTITFPVAFSSVLGVYVGQMGYTSGSDPTDVTSPTIPDGNNVAVVFADTVTTTNFRAYYTLDSSATLSSTLRKCFTWWAIGVV